MNTKMPVAVASLCLFLSQTVCATSYPSHYSAEAIAAKVINAETKQPLEGVVVVAHWQLYYSTVGGRIPAGQLMVMETVTDKDGKFSFPAWGPKKAPKYKNKINDNWIGNIPLFTPDTYLDDLDPALILFKSGYKYRGLQNPTRSTTDHSPVRRSMWNGKTIEMKLFRGTIHAYKPSFESMNQELERVVTDKPEDCIWKKLPRALAAIGRERKRLEDHGIDPHTLFSLDRELIMNDEYFTTKGKAPCGSPKEFLRSILQ